MIVLRRGNGKEERREGYRAREEEEKEEKTKKEGVRGYRGMEVGVMNGQKSLLQRV